MKFFSETKLVCGEWGVSVAVISPLQYKVSPAAWWLIVAKRSHHDHRQSPPPLLSGRGCLQESWLNIFTKILMFSLKAEK